MQRWLDSMWSARETLFVALALSGFFGAGCMSKDQSKTIQNRQSRQVITSEQDLRGLLSAGMTTNDIVLRLGEPSQTIVTRSGIQWLYALPGFPADGGMKGTYVVGALLSITNGSLASWGCSYATDFEGQGGRGPAADAGSDHTRTQNSELNIFVVSPEPIING